MIIFERECLPFRLSADAPTYHEQWVSGTYLMTGIFPVQADRPTVGQVVASIPTFYRDTRLKKKAGWPRGVCGFYLVPIYCSNGFPEETRAWVSHRPKYRWAIWHEPMLFDTAKNEAYCFVDWGLYGRAFRKFIFTVLGVGAMVMSRRFGHDVLPRINGEQMQIEGAQPGATDNPDSARF